MNTAIEILGYGGLAPPALSFVMALLLRRFLPSGAADRYSMAVALGTAFFVGYALLPSWAPLWPERHWHWLPYLGAAAMVLGPVALATGVFSPERWLLYALLAIAAACLLVPTWPGLQPPRPVHLCILAGYLFPLAVLLDSLPDVLLGPVYPVMLFFASACTAALLAVFVSVVLGQVAGICAAAMCGCAVWSCWGVPAMAWRGLTPVFVVLAGGAAFVGSIEPTPSLFAILLAPAAPLALWTCAWGPLARLRGAAAVVAQFLVVLLPLAIAVAWAIIGRP